MLHDDLHVSVLMYESGGVYGGRRRDLRLRRLLDSRRISIMSNARAGKLRGVRKGVDNIKFLPWFRQIERNVGLLTRYPRGDALGSHPLDQPRKWLIDSVYNRLKEGT